MLENLLNSYPWGELPKGCAAISAGDFHIDQLRYAKENREDGWFSTAYYPSSDGRCYRIEWTRSNPSGISLYYRLDDGTRRVSNVNGRMNVFVFIDKIDSSTYTFR